MGGGGKGGSSTQTTMVQLPPSLERGANEVLAAGMDAASLPYTPNRGVTIADFSNQQKNAIRSVNDMAAAFGMRTGGDPFAGLPKSKVTKGSGGIRGFATGDMYDAMVDESVSKKQQKRRQQLLKNYEGSADRIREIANGNTPGQLTPAFQGGNPGNGPIRDQDESHFYQKWLQQQQPPETPDEPARSAVMNQLSGQAVMPSPNQGNNRLPQQGVNSAGKDPSQLAGNTDRTFTVGRVNNRKRGR